MYSKQQASQLTQEFWTAFGLYMSPVLSAEGEKTNWVNYKTGEKNISFRLNAGNKKAIVSIELSHRDPELRQLYFEQFRSFQKMLEDIMKETWTWQLHMQDEHGKQISRIYTEINGINIFRKEDWPDLISFFKSRIIALDAFWSAVKYAFESLR